jgi:hypothetical protein
MRILAANIHITDNSCMVSSGFLLKASYTLFSSALPLPHAFSLCIPEFIAKPLLLEPLIFLCNIPSYWAVLKLCIKYSEFVAVVPTKDYIEAPPNCELLGEMISIICA